MKPFKKKSVTSFNFKNTFKINEYEKAWNWSSGSCCSTWFLTTLHLRGNHSTLIQQRCDNVLRWHMKLTFVNSERWLQNVMCTHGLSLILVVLFSRYTEIETLFSFISIRKMITVCDRRYFEKPIDIVCWACMSLIQYGKVLCWPWSMIAYLTIQRFKSQIEKLCFSSTSSFRLRYYCLRFRWGSLVYRPIALWISLISIMRSVCRDQWWTTKASLENSLFWKFTINCCCS